MRLGAYPAYLEKGRLLVVPTKRRWCPNVTATATRSIMLMSKNWKRLAWFFWYFASDELMEIAELPKSKHPFFSAPNFILNLPPGPLPPTPCLPNL